MAIATNKKYIKLKQAFANKKLDSNEKNEGEAIKNRQTAYISDIAEIIYAKKISERFGETKINKKKFKKSSVN